MFRLIVIIFFFTSIFYSQQSNSIKQSGQVEGVEIISNARQAIGLDKTGEVLSYFFKYKKIFPFKESTDLEIVEEVNLELPDKIRVVERTESPLPTQLSFSGQTTKTWNGKKYKAISDTEMSGKRTVKDITNEETKPVSKAVSDVIGKKSASALEEARKADPKNVFTESLWTSLFPLILSHPFEKNIEFNYVGKAKSNDKTANVIDVKPANGKTYRLLFDSETNYLLMMIVSYRASNDRFVGDIETKYYFSERELVDGVLIPKKIKIESKASPEGKPTTVKYSNIEIVDFKINSKFDEKIFEIK